MTLPKVVYIGPADYDIKEKKQLDLLGETDSGLTRILLREKQSDSAKRGTLIHEILHAIIFEAGIHKAFDLSHDDEEKLVSALAPWLVSLLDDNPELIAYLQSGEAA